jgi:hypothetical protein
MKIELNDDKYCKHCQYPKLEYSSWIQRALGLVCDCGSKVPDLEEMDITQITDDDCLLISDVSEKKRKKVKISTLKQYILHNDKNF